MKRFWMAVAVLLMAIGFAFFAQANPEMRPGYEGRHGGFGMMGPGMGGPGWGMHPGMGGFGMMGPGMGGFGMMGPGMLPFWDDLPKPQQQRLLQLHTAMMNAMGAKMADVQKKMIDLREVSLAFPLDQKAVMAKWNALSEARGEMFQLRLAMLAQMQGTVGKERWEKLQRHGHGHGHSG